ncbi:hypothetical protein DUNSADRAFT_3131 [Dunaliella salina]|uniref:Encoded protein n=1 Tax=Dunaliella salina TaxID=3046 RepID=A0ABQ7H818_DUNSA|nr:hypothetical protein DUNSADRAFT_3131 [Dunaliella salina]|eukprot:KAF5843002.1 hypothetical protein DUNSADRAFT_3131 [Dunaliella salina]
MLVMPRVQDLSCHELECLVLPFTLSFRAWPFHVHELERHEDMPDSSMFMLSFHAHLARSSGKGILQGRFFSVAIQHLELRCWVVIVSPTTFC